MLNESGFRTLGYDPFYVPDQERLSDTYDFITCTEVVEHLHDPAGTFQLLDQCLKPGGWLGVMTCFQTDDERFANWHYRRDPTHVVFYRQETMRVLAGRLGWECTIPRKDVALFRKAGGLSDQPSSRYCFLPGTPSHSSASGGASFSR